MEPASLALSIATLYSTCRDCYSFFTNVKAAEAESSAHLRELEIQQSILNAWGFHWQIQNDSNREPERSDRSGQKRNKLNDYLSSNRFKAEGVFSTLSALADTLSNQEKLVKRYGIQFQSVPTIQNGPSSNNNVQLMISDTNIEDVQPVISEVKKRLSVLNKFKWALKDRDDFKKLIADLRSHSESLYRLCPENAYESMNIYLTMECLARQESPAGLKRTSKLAIQQAEVDVDSSVRGGYELLAAAATLKASVNENKRPDPVHAETLSSVDEAARTMRYLGKGLALFEDEIVYVEMRDYRGPPVEYIAESERAAQYTPDLDRATRRRSKKGLRPSRRLRGGSLYTRDYSETGMDDYISDGGWEDVPREDVQLRVVERPADPKSRALIRNFFNTFHGASMRESVYGLDVAGMIDHTEGEYKGHCSILYRLPGTNGRQSRERPAENLKLRAPVTLQSLLGTRTIESVRCNLGSRFEMARKLVRAVCLLHSTGWLHKNIRAESVMFFPEPVSETRPERSESKTEIDVANPVLMGYIFSRPDDVDIPLPPRPALQDADHADLQPATGPRSSDSTTVIPIFTDRHSRADRSSLRGPGMRNTWASTRYERLGSSGISRNSSIYGLNMTSRVSGLDQTSEMSIIGFTLDYYQHPAKHADPKRLYRHAYDVYSLGILLLEVGLWEQLRNYEEKPIRPTSPGGFLDRGYRYEPRPVTVVEEDHYERRRWICREYLDRLRWACGDVYADVVLSCLMIDSSDDEVAKVSQRELCARIVADLENCRA